MTNEYKMNVPLLELWRLLYTHDWWYERSDDPSVRQKGAANKSNIDAQVQAVGPSGKALRSQFYSWMRRKIEKPAPPSIDLDAFAHLESRRNVLLSNIALYRLWTPQLYAAHEAVMRKKRQKAALDTVK